jgi:CRISPR-associated protein Cmr6
MAFQFPLPQDTRQKFIAANQMCSNLSLLLDRYVGYESNWEFKEEQKTDFFKKIEKANFFHVNFIEQYYRRWQAIAQSLPHAQTFTASPEWRMVVGLGQSSILETSMTLDRITGIPTIPGSALKGLAATYAMLGTELSTTDRVKAEEDSTFKAIFGTQGEAGKVIFLDAVPTKPPTLEPDIMNNHHQEYYGDKQGNTPPAPWDSPIPVYFLTLGHKSEFAFAVAGRDSEDSTQELVNQATGWLKTGLSELGIGAKTAAGYGYMISN